MAILSKEINQVEVRIKRHPGNTFFKEYVKVGDRENPDATSCNRYIVPEPGAMFTVEVTLKRGYQFGNCRAVRALLYLDGHEKDISRLNIFRPPDCNRDGFLEQDLTVELAYASNIEVNGRNMSGSRFTFREISVGQFSIYWD